MSNRPATFPTPAAIVWRKSQTDSGLFEAFIDGKMIAWLLAQPSYMDRGHWLVGIDPVFYAELTIEGADAFPRYYMGFVAAIQETEDFLRWRLWKIAAPGRDVPAVVERATSGEKGGVMLEGFRSKLTPLSFDLEQSTRKKQ